jgi:hypothetical protein
LETGRFVADCGGLIRQIVLSLPADFFALTTHQWFQPLIPIGNLLQAFPTGIDTFLLVEPRDMPQAQRWAGSLEASCNIVFVAGAEDRNTVNSPWTQDAFLVRKLPAERSADIEILTLETGGAAASIADFLSVPKGLLPASLPGGNQLVGPDFRLVGHSQLVGRSATRAGSTKQTIDLLEKLQALDERPIRIFGYRPERPRRQTGGTRLSELEDFVRNGHQFGFHVDQFVSVTGLERGNRPLLIVGEPCGLEDGTVTPLIEEARRALDASAVELIRQGFEVLRNPLPYVITPDSRKRLPRLYNNLILENEIRSGRERPLVWLPQFGDAEPLEKFDRMNSAVWEELGFDVAPIYGCSYLASRNGSLRCLSKILSREDESSKKA